MWPRSPEWNALSGDGIDPGRLAGAHEVSYGRRDQAQPVRAARAQVHGLADAPKRIAPRYLLPRTAAAHLHCEDAGARIIPSERVHPSAIPHVSYDTTVHNDLNELRRSDRHARIGLEAVRREAGSPRRRHRQDALLRG